MSTPFTWPMDLKPAGIKRITKSVTNSRFILVRRRADAKTGRHKTSSSSDGLIDIAVAVQLGLLPSAGLPGLWLNANKKRVETLLKHNTIAAIKPKKATTNGNHATKSVLILALKALSVVLGPAYWEASGHLGARKALNTGRLISWIKNNLEDTSSPLCVSLNGGKYADLIGLKRSTRWWRDLLELRQKGQSNLRP